MEKIKSDEKEMKLEKKLFIGVNGSGKTNELEKIIKNLKKDRNNNVLFFSSLDEPEKNSTKSTDPQFKNLAWFEFISFIEEMTTYKITFKMKDFIEEERKKKENEIPKKILDLKKEDIQINLLDSFTTAITKSPNKELKIMFEKKFSNITDIMEHDNEVPIKLMNIKKPIKKLFDDEIEKNRGTGNYQYFIIKIIFEIVKSKIPISKKGNLHLVLDEPEKHLHFSMARRVSYMLEKISKYVNVYIASHSPVIMNRMVDHETKIHKCLHDSKDNKSKCKELTLIMKKRHSQSFTFKTRLLESLIAEKIFFVEGNNDLQLLDLIIEEIRQKNNSSFNENYNIQICHNKSSIKKYYNPLINMYNFEPNNTFIIFDKDNDKDNDEIQEHKK
jgi:predicted ATP-dependent endonuclease of OLD family